MTEYKLNHFTMADAQALAGMTADITAWDDDELETKITYPGAKITGIIDRIGPYLVIETAGAVITDARTGEQLGTRPPEPELHLLFTWVCEVDGVRARFERGDRVALEHTDDPDTRLRPGDEGTVTRYAPGLGQFSERLSVECGLDLVFYVACMSVTCREGMDRGGFPARPHGLVPLGCGSGWRRSGRLMSAWNVTAGQVLPDGNARGLSAPPARRAGFTG